MHREGKKSKNPNAFPNFFASGENSPPKPQCPLLLERCQVQPARSSPGATARLNDAVAEIALQTSFSLGKRAAPPQASKAGSHGTARTRWWELETFIPAEGWAWLGTMPGVCSCSFPPSSWQAKSPALLENQLQGFRGRTEQNLLLSRPPTAACRCSPPDRPGHVRPAVSNASRKGLYLHDCSIAGFDMK